MQEHLNDDQLDELFRFAPNGRERLSLDRAVSDEVQTHLDNCNHCRERVRAQRELMDRLSFLKINDVSLAGPECPPEDVWFEIAAGIKVESVDGLLDHASRCDHCGPLLRQAVEDCAGELTQQEDLRIAGLRSSDLEWQRELVSRLCQKGSVRGADAPDKKRWWSTLPKVFAPVQLAFGASLAGLLLLGVTNYRLATKLSSERTQAEVEISRLRTDLASQNRNIVGTDTASGVDLIHETSTPPQSSTTSQSSSSAKSQASLNISPIVYVALASGLTRGPGQMNRVAIPPQTEIARITIQVPDIQPGLLQEQLVTPDGNRIWSQTVEPSPLELRTKVVSIFLPAYLLAPNDYEIVISHESADGSDRLGSYPFRVVR